MVPKWTKSTSAAKTNFIARITIGQVCFHYFTNAVGNAFKSSSGQMGRSMLKIQTCQDAARFGVMNNSFFTRKPRQTYQPIATRRGQAGQTIQVSKGARRRKKQAPHPIEQSTAQRRE